MTGPPYPIHPSIAPKLDPEYAAFYNTHVINNPQPQNTPLEQTRCAGGKLVLGAGPLLPVGATEDIHIPRVASTGPDVLIRAFTPSGSPPPSGWPAVIYFHGGGWVLGTVDTENVVATNLCNRAGCVVVNVDYRLAPENTFPAAVEDAWEAVLWVLGKGREVLSIDVDKLATGGSSAGGNLAAVLCQRAVSRGSPSFKLQLLSVPVMDNTAVVGDERYPSWTENALAPGLPAEKMMWFRRHYLPEEKDWKHPEASPLFWEGDWSKLPRAVFVVGELDILRDEGREFARRLEEKGVRADVNVMDGQPHPFLAMDGVLEAGRRAITLFVEALRETMYPEGNQSSLCRFGQCK